MISVLTLHPTLLIGPADWQPEHMPKEEFLQRIAALWGGSPGASHAIVYGDSAHHAELAYLTNVTPKLEPAVALLARTAEPRLYVGGGPNMLAAARPLTWISDVLPLKDVGAAVGRFAAPTVAAAVGNPVCGPLLIGGGAMSTALLRTVTDAAATGGPLPDATAQLRRQMRRKSPRELSAIRAACAILASAIAAIDAARRAGAGVTAAVLAGERAANVAGAQDARTLFSIDGGRMLAPFVTAIERPVDPLQVYVAVRHLNYWAEGFALLADRPSAIADHAQALLHAAIAAAIAGADPHAIARQVAAGARPYALHTVIESDVVATLGLALDGAPGLSVSAAALEADAERALVAGEVCSIRVGLTDGAGADAIVSAMVLVGAYGSDVFWM